MDEAPYGIGNICKQLVLKRQFTQTFSLENLEFGTKIFSTSQTFLIHFNILEKQIIYIILTGAISYKRPKSVRDPRTKIPTCSWVFCFT